MAAMAAMAAMAGVAYLQSGKSYLYNKNMHACIRLTKYDDMQSDGGGGGCSGKQAAVNKIAKRRHFTSVDFIGAKYKHIFCMRRGDMRTSRLC